MEKLFEETERAILEAYETTIGQLLKLNGCISGDTSIEQEIKIDKCIASLAEVTTSIIWQNRKQMTFNRAIAILKKYVEADLENGKLSTDVLSTLKEDCGCSNVELEEIGLEWI